MKKASVDMSKKHPSAKNKSAKDSTAILENPATAKKPSKIDEKFSAFIRKNGETPPDNFVADFKAHIFDVDGEVYGYVLSKSKPAMGIFGCLTSDDDPKTWAFNNAKDSYEISVVQAKEVTLLRVFNKARTAAQTECDGSNSEAVDIEVEQVDQADAEQSNEQPEERDDTVVARLAALSDFEYDRMRKLEAKRLRIRVTTLDNAVANEKNLVNDLKIIGPRMLSDVYETITSQDVNQISSNELISVLCADKNKSWSVFNRGDQITPKQLAHILSLYGVSPRDIRFSNVVLKGYTRESIVAAYLRFITPTIQP